MSKIDLIVEFKQEMNRRMETNNKTNVLMKEKKIRNWEGNGSITMTMDGFYSKLISFRRFRPKENQQGKIFCTKPAKIRFRFQSGIYLKVDDFIKYRSTKPSTTSRREPILNGRQ